MPGVEISESEGLVVEGKNIIKISHPEKVKIKYQGLTINLMGLLDKLNNADLLPEPERGNN